MRILKQSESSAMLNLPLLLATVIGSWSFPGWYAHFCEEAGPACRELFGSDDREEAGPVGRGLRLAVEDQLRAGGRPGSPTARCSASISTSASTDYLGVFAASLPTTRRWGPPAHDQRSRHQAASLPWSALRGPGIVEEYRRVSCV